ncbi:cytochrome P450 2C31 [Hypoxylon rubiginosum]|uniref:Cytochrome P450 2C31 n=1 Tax=Hypoxylon rubiginosum TaxID=110542 RepID=A0ACB9YKA7_9PEZI|nr:cytochrome P450 2C31 [Hypoxylon rubiginosum]
MDLTYNLAPYLPSWTILILLLPWIALYIVLLPPHKRRFSLGKRFVMPRGPSGQMLLGNLPSWLRARRERATNPWLAKQARYGELTTLSMGSRTWVLVNTSRMINEILAKQTKSTHDRPWLPIAGGLVSRDLRPFLKRAADWKDGRRLVHHLLMGPRSKDHENIIEDTSLGLLRTYLDEPGAWYLHNYRYAVAIMYKIVTNSPLDKSRSELNDLQEVTRTFLEAISNTFVEFFPHLTLLPKLLQFWRPRWEAVGTFHYNVFKHWWAGMKPLAKRDEEPSFLDTVMGEFNATDEEAMYLTMAVIVAGSDNTRITMNSGIGICLAYPTAIQIARDELDKVCGAISLRLPRLDDLPNLPYMCAVVKEVLRWRPVSPLLPPRLLTDDIEVEGYRFPAGTEFLVNMIAVGRHGRDDPTEFKPERWFDVNNNEERARGDAGITQGLWQYAFAAGKRSCVGYKLAQKEIFLGYARLFYCFNFFPVGQFVSGQLETPTIGEPFPIKVAVRSPAHERLIREESERCTFWGQE